MQDMQKVWNNTWTLCYRPIIGDNIENVIVKNTICTLFSTEQTRTYIAQYIAHISGSSVHICTSVHTYHAYVHQRLPRRWFENSIIFQANSAYISKEMWHNVWKSFHNLQFMVEVMDCGYGNKLWLASFLFGDFQGHQLCAIEKIPRQTWPPPTHGSVPYAPMIVASLLFDSLCIGRVLVGQRALYSRIPILARIRPWHWHRARKS